MSTRVRVRDGLEGAPFVLALVRLVRETVRICLRYRVTGLAAEAGFFALLSLPPLVLGLFGGVGYVGSAVGQSGVDDFTERIASYAGSFLTPQVIDDLLLPTVDEVFRAGRGELISIGFLLSVWSGSRVLNVFIDTISIMYGQSGIRGIVRTRAMSLSIYTLGLLFGVVMMPLVLVGPSAIGSLLPDPADWLVALYWPVVSVLVLAGVTTLFHLSTPQRDPWRRDLPGAALTLVLWVLSAWLVRTLVAGSLGGTSIYGPLSTPIILIVGLYAIAISVLVGAALNAAVRSLWPHSAADRSIAQA
ncbi:YihY/virulence factor BrkB family protein [Janibacter melonis]|uniref:YihY/virulence factor BrkB family protein n=1 Tax=Janibacter melonis TaxID=262209 RepID=UPI002044198C|nr:YihY/virulence factor BrkB family protein [Janibacter melonis]MCM3554702.1 YihY/virulence factor BrkB family protein [Janibacter melonis]